MYALRLSFAATALLSLSACQQETTQTGSIAETRSEEETRTPQVVAGSDVEAGRYIMIIGNCHDCHTEGYLATEGDVPENDWLQGSKLGWRGPWGTTYPPNLRLTVQDLDEDAFVQMAHSRRSLPPMPWMNLNQMTDRDLRSVYRYLKAIGPAGERAPAPLPPEVEPDTPYLLLVPQGGRATIESEN